MSQNRTILKNISSLTIENMVRLGVGFVLSVLLARLLSVEDYGRYNYLVSYSLIFLPFFNFSSDDIIIKKIVNPKSDEKDWFSSGNSLRLLSGIFGVLLGGCAFFLIGRDPTQNIPYVLFFLFLYLFKSIDSFKLFYQARSNESKLVKPRLLVFVLLGIMKFLGAYIFGGWRLLIVFSALEVPLFSLVQYLRFKIDYQATLKIFDRSVSHIKSLFFESFPLFLVAFLSFVLMKVDQLMIPKLLNYESLSFYSVSAKLVDLWSFVPQVIVISLYPKILNTGQDLKTQRARELYSLVFYCAFTLCIAVHLLGPVLIKYLYGERYMASATVIGVYSFTLIFNFFNLARQKVFVSEGMQALSISVSLLALLLNIIFNFYAILRFGVVGAVYGTLAAHLCSNVFISLFSKGVRKSLLDAVCSIVNPMRYFKI